MMMPLLLLAKTQALAGSAGIEMVQAAHNGLDVPVPATGPAMNAGRKKTPVNDGRFY
jgi:uncharacterized protein (DUF111 family)